MTFKELTERMKNENFNAELFFRNGVAVEATFETYDSYRIGKRLRPIQGAKGLKLYSDIDSREIVKNSLEYDRMIRKEEIKQGKRREDFDFATRDMLHNKMIKLLEEK